jgi:hypothetical protein
MRWPRRLRSSSLEFSAGTDDALAGCFGAVCDRRQHVFMGQPRILVEQFGLGHVVGEKIEDQ